MNNFTSFEILSTFAGATAATTLVTQVLKAYINVDAKWIAGIVALTIQLGLQLFYVKDISIAGILLAIINAFFLLSASVGAFEITNHKKNKEKRLK